jgi:hypothetical protein
LGFRLEPPAISPAPAVTIASAVAATTSATTTIASTVTSSASTTATTASAAAISSASTTTAVTTVASASAAMSTTTARSLRTRFVHLQYAAFQIKSIEGRDHRGHICTRPQFHESKATGTAGFRITDHARRGDLKRIAHEKLIEALIRRVKREVSYVELRHGNSPFSAPLILRMSREKRAGSRCEPAPSRI